MSDIRFPVDPDGQESDFMNATLQGEGDFVFSIAVHVKGIDVDTMGDPDGDRLAEFSSLLKRFLDMVESKAVDSAFGSAGVFIEFEAEVGYEEGA